MNDCLFCKIVNKEIDAKILYEDEDVMCFLDAFPNVEGHTLVVPKKHFTDIYELDNETLNKLFEVAKKQGNIIKDKLNKDSLTFLFNYGEDQKIKHVHLHILPEYLKQEKIEKETEEIYKTIKG